jgi:hypothetical protein
VAGIKGAQRIGSIQAIAADDSARFLTNPSFGQLDGTLAAPTSIPGWTPTGGIGNFELVESPTYRSSTEEGDTPRALKFTTNDILVQNFNVNSVSFNPNVPYYLQIAWNRSEGTGDGTLSLMLGSQTESVALAAQSGWQILRIALGTKNWFQNWNQEDPTVSIQLASNTTGYVLVDDVVLAPFTNFDGGWYALVGGTTPFLYDDIFTFTDTEVGAIIQEWLWRLYGIYLPPAVTPTWADPA